MLVTLQLEMHCVFPSSKALVRFRKPLKLSEVNLGSGDIFIMIKAITQQVADWLIAWAFV